MWKRECWTCWEVKPLPHFSKDPNIADKYSHRCRSCTKMYRKYINEKKTKELPPIEWPDAPSFKVSFE